jgi:zinc transporter 1/2/3
VGDLIDDFWLRLDDGWADYFVVSFAKYFGSGVIIATAFIHLLYHAIITLDTPCLGEGWHEYVSSLLL